VSNKNKHNSIVFLTTLSVYLGLVLIGAPPVLAQAALTKNFDIQSEIKTKDDLDNKPEKDELKEDIEIIQKLNLVQAITNFVADLKKLESIGKFNSKTDWNFSYKVWLQKSGDFSQISKNSDISNPWLETAVSEIISTVELSDISSISDHLPNCKGDSSCRETYVEISSNANEFSLVFLFKKSNPEKSKLAAIAFNKVFISQKIALKKFANPLIYENTETRSENNQVFIVTRLPRGSLDELLKNVKAESK